MGKVTGNFIITVICPLPWEMSEGWLSCMECKTNRKQLTSWQEKAFYLSTIILSISKLNSPIKGIDWVNRLKENKI